MKYEELIKKFPSGIVSSKDLGLYFADIETMRVSLSRWQKRGQLIQLKRGIYILPEHYRKNTIFNEAIASRLIEPSYLSLEKALEYYGLIPEKVQVYTMVTPRRSNQFINPLGTFKYHHIKQEFFFGYKAVQEHRQKAFIAEPEKAIIDLIYLRFANFDLAILDQLRLQNIQLLDQIKILNYAQRIGKETLIKKTELLVDYLNNIDEGVLI